MYQQNDSLCHYYGHPIKKKKKKRRWREYILRDLIYWNVWTRLSASDLRVSLLWFWWGHQRLFMVIVTREYYIWSFSFDRYCQCVVRPCSHRLDTLYLIDSPSACSHACEIYITYFVHLHMFLCACIGNCSRLYARMKARICLDRDDVCVKWRMCK